MRPGLRPRKNRGYGAFTISVSEVQSTIAYIKLQPEHHKTIDFQAEFVAFLKKHGIEYDPKYALG